MILLNSLISTILAIETLSETFTNNVAINRDQDNFIRKKEHGDHSSITTGYQSQNPIKVHSIDKSDMDYNLRLLAEEASKLKANNNPPKTEESSIVRKRRGISDENPDNDAIDIGVTSRKKPK